MYSFLKGKNPVLVFLFSVLLCMALFMTGCSKNTSQQVDKNDKTMTFIFNFKTGSLDPHNSDVHLKAGVLETLVRLDENLEVKPWLATKWVAKDDRTWVFTIRDGVTFQDGTKVDAAAVKASFERGIAISKLLAGILKNVSMEASGQELTIITKEPQPSLPSELVSPYASIISVEAEKKMGTTAFNMAPVGTGPFKVTKFTPNIDIQLDAYDGYWDGKAKLSRVTVKFNEDGNVRALALQSKEADVVYQIPAETVAVIQQDQELTVASVASLRAHYLLYNYQQPLLQDSKVRKAFDLLLNRQSVVQDIMLGYATAANGPFNPNLPFGNKETIKQLNTEEAKRILEDAGFKAGRDGKLEKDGKPLTLQLLTYKGRPELPMIAQLLQSDAAKIGVTLEIKMVENVDTYLRENKDWDLVTYSNLTAPRGDGGYFLNSAFLPGGSLNPANSSSDKLSQLIGQLNKTGDISQRIKISQEAVGIVNEEVFHSYVVYPNLIVGMNKRVVDWKPSAAEYYVVSNKIDVK